MPAAGRVVEIDVDRLSGWVDRFTDRHGTVSITLPAGHPRVIAITAGDGALAQLAIPYGPLPPVSDDTAVIERLVAHLRSARTVGILLVRRGGWAVGVVENGALVAVDTGGGYVQGSTKAGGWSQQRYARRRGNQTQQVWQRAIDGAARLLPARGSLDALVTGGDKAGVRAVLSDPRLADLSAIVEPRFLAVPDPTPAVLADAVRRLTSVVITLNEHA